MVRPKAIFSSHLTLCTLFFYIQSFFREFSGRRLVVGEIGTQTGYGLEDGKKEF